MPLDRLQNVLWLDQALVSLLLANTRAHERLGRQARIDHAHVDKLAQLVESDW